MINVRDSHTVVSRVFAEKGSVGLEPCVSQSAPSRILQGSYRGWLFQSFGVDVRLVDCHCGLGGNCTPSKKTQAVLQDSRAAVGNKGFERIHPFSIYLDKKDCMHFKYPDSSLNFQGILVL